MFSIAVISIQTQNQGYIILHIFQLECQYHINYIPKPTYLNLSCQDMTAFVVYKHKPGIYYAVYISTGMPISCQYVPTPTNLIKPF